MKEKLIRAFSKDNIKYMILIALFDAITSQIFIDMIILNFRISISVIILPIFYYYNRKLSPIATSIFIASFGLFFRSLLTYISTGDFLLGFFNDYNIAFFDISYGLIYYYLMKKRNYDERTIIMWFSSIWACDFFSNAIEITSRFHTLKEDVVVIFNKLLLVGLIRASIAVLVVLVFEYYRMIFHKEKQLEKYKEMIGIVSDLKSELYFMKSNMGYIEGVMKDAYSLYENSVKEDYKRKSLRIAKDIHEVKKNYQRVLIGMENLGEKDSGNFSITLSEILDILKDTYEKDSKFKLHDCKIIVSLHFDRNVKKHYYMMSIFRNLFNNSIESFKRYTNNYIKILVYKEDKKLKIRITDNGSGIKKKDLAYICKAGYSTKFDESTGNIYRGMGLSIIKDIVEKEFGGEIFIESTIGIGTEIKIVIPIFML